MGIVRDLIIAIVGAVAGGFIVLGFEYVGRWWQERRGLLTGKWTGMIFDPSSGNVIKEDVVVCRQRRNSVHADISRLKPEDQSKRRWGFIGRYHDGAVFGYFWSSDPMVYSFGTIFLRQTTAEKFSGYMSDFIA